MNKLGKDLIHCGRAFGPQGYWQILYEILKYPYAVSYPERVLLKSTMVKKHFYHVSVQKAFPCNHCISYLLLMSLR